MQKKYTKIYKNFNNTNIKNSKSSLKQKLLD